VITVAEQEFSCWNRIRHIHLSSQQFVVCSHTLNSNATSVTVIRVTWRRLAAQIDERQLVLLIHVQHDVCGWTVQALLIRVTVEAAMVTRLHHVKGELRGAI